MTELTDDDLAAIEARANAATPGPWFSSGPNLNTNPHVFELDYWNGGDDAIKHANRNAVFIAHARNDIPRLIAEVRRLREIIAEKDEKAKYNYYGL